MKNLLLIMICCFSLNVNASSMKELLNTFEDSVYIFINQLNTNLKIVQFSDYELKSASDDIFSLKANVKIQNSVDQSILVLTCEGQVSKSSTSFESLHTNCF